MTLSVWYRGQELPTVTRCMRCGSEEHSVTSCPHEKRVCFMCKQPDHPLKQCPLNDGTKQNDDTLIFLSGKCVLSNFNTNFPVVIHDVQYSCSEQYIQSQKCKLFGDKASEIRIMNSNDPREMKAIGDNVRNYKHGEWMNECERIATECSEAKFRTHEQARRYLLQTGEKCLGVGTRSKKWGVGLHVSDPDG